MKKRIIFGIIAIVLCFSLTGCSLSGFGTAAFFLGLLGGSAYSGYTNETDQKGEIVLTEPDGEYGYWEEDVAFDAYEYEAATGAFYDPGLYGNSIAYGEVSVPDWNTEEYSYYEDNPWMSVQASPFSTFAADVDTASYANIRRKILRGERIPEDAVRIEEMVNYFRYNYSQPEGSEPFSVTTEIAPCPWNEDTELLMIGLQAKGMEGILSDSSDVSEPTGSRAARPREDLDMSERPASNLVFLIDVSGSMDEYNKLPLVQRAFRLLAENLGENDRVSLVTYANGDTVVLEGVSGGEQTVITDAIEDLVAEGGTNGSAGIQTAYELAERYFIEGGNNRVILATDGDLNIGITDEGSLTRLIQEKAKSGVYLSVLGFGTGNISDSRMQALADNGNGNYSYIDDIAEARKVLIDEMGGTLFTVAKDVKLQVEFNPAAIKGYRLIGYENRIMAAEEFADDTKDGGEIGAGHQVTALYEIARVSSNQEIPEIDSRYGGQQSEEVSTTDVSELLALNIRYKEPDGDESTLLTYPVTDAAASTTMSENLSWAAGVAQVGMILRGSEYLGDTTLETVQSRLEGLESANSDDYRKEFLYLITKLKGIGY